MCSVLLMTLGGLVTYGLKTGCPDADLPITFAVISL